MATTKSDTKGVPEDVRAAFRKYEREISVVNSRRAAVIAAIFMLGGALLDIVVFPEHFVIFLIIRIICCCLLILIYFDLKRPEGNFVAVWIALLPILSICIMIYFTGGGNSPYYAGLNIVLVGLSLLLRWNFGRSLVMTVICSACYFASVELSVAKSDFRILFNNSYFLFVTSVFVIVGSYFYERLRLSEFALRTEVELSHQRLGELDEAKTRFFANISHELRTPLTIMLGITERLGQTLKSDAKVPEVPEVPEMVGLLEQNGLRLMKLIDDLLDLVRFDTGHTDLIFQPTPIKPHFEGLMKSLRHLSEQDNVALNWTCETAHTAILLDRDKFDKIVLNLVINSIKFTPSGGNIDVNLLLSDDRLNLSVKDTGVGIPKENLERVFERFWQVDTSSTRKFQGTGIGLALVRALAESLRGSVGVTSQIGFGTNFTVTFPIESTTMNDGADKEPETGRGIVAIHRKAAMALPSKSGAKPKLHEAAGFHTSPHIGTRESDAKPLVLIADDEPDIRRFLIMQLNHVEVLEASDGAEALELAKLHRPQIALLDHMMPELDGVEVCRRIRLNHATRDTSVIILTARADEQTKLDALQAGASDFLTKPFSTVELGLRLNNQIQMGRFRREMADMNRDLNSALEKIKENEVLMLRNEKLSALGRMSAGIIHEINNPLNYANAGLHALATFAPLLPREEQHDFEDTLKDIGEGIARVSQIVIDLRQFTYEGKTESLVDRIAPDEIIRRAIRMINHQLGQELRIELISVNSPQIIGNANQLVQVFINLLQNSIDAIRERKSGNAELEGLIGITISDENGNVMISVRDNGIGIPPEDVNRIFDPFFTSKQVGSGMGLGLSITHQILRNHRATVSVDSRPGEFTQIHLLFPNASQFLKSQESDKREEQLSLTPLIYDNI